MRFDRPQPSPKLNNKTIWEDFIEKDKTSKVTIKMTYKNKLVNKDIFLDDLSIKLNLEKEDGSSSQITINPQTGDNIMLYVVLCLTSLAGLIVVIKKRSFN